MHGALEATVNPAIAASFAVFGLMEMVKHFGEAAEVAKEKAHEAFVQLITDADAARDAIQGVRDKQEDFWRDYDERQQQSSEKSAFDSALSGIQAKMEESKKLLETQKQLELEGLNSAEKAGLIPKDLADSQRVHIEAESTADLGNGVTKGASDEQGRELIQRHDELEDQRSKLQHDLEIQGAANTSPEALKREENVKDLQTFLGDLGKKKIGGVKFGSLLTGNEGGEEMNFPAAMGGGKINIENDSQFEMFHGQAKAMLDRLTAERKAAQDNEAHLQSELNRVIGERNEVAHRGSDLNQKTGIGIGAGNQIDQLNKLTDALKQLSALGVVGNPGGVHGIVGAGVSASSNPERAAKNFPTISSAAEQKLEELLSASGFSSKAIQRLLGELVRNHAGHRSRQCGGFYKRNSANAEKRITDVLRRANSIGK